MTSCFSGRDTWRSGPYVQRGMFVFLRCAFTVAGGLLRAICLVFFIQLVISFTLSVFVPTMIFFAMTVCSLFAMTVCSLFAMTIETVSAVGIEHIVSILAGAARRCSRVGIGSAWRGLYFRLELAFRTSPIIQHIVYCCTLYRIK